jgi:hypothetical protein
MDQHASTSSGPNPLCEVGRRHPRDRHRTRPVEGQEHLWYCSRHSIYAQLVDKEVADAYARGDDYAMPTGGAGIVVQHGDERQGGVILYFREK